MKIYKDFALYLWWLCETTRDNCKRIADSSWTIISSKIDKGAYRIVTERDNTILELSFDGTSSFIEMLSNLTALSFRGVHRGVAKNAKRLFFDFVEKCGGVNEIVRDHGVDEVRIVGHSRGGALAREFAVLFVSAFYLNTPVRVYTFGANNTRTRRRWLKTWQRHKFTEVAFNTSREFVDNLGAPIFRANPESRQITLKTVRGKFDHQAYDDAIKLTSADGRKYL